MASQTVRFEYDADGNTLFAQDDFEIISENDVEAFLALYRGQVDRIGHPVYVVTQIDGLKVGGKVFAHYGRALKAFADRWYLGIARWGTDPAARMTVRTASLSAKYDVNIFATREEAVAAVEAMKRRTP